MHVDAGLILRVIVCCNYIALLTKKDLYLTANSGEILDAGLKGRVNRVIVSELSQKDAPLVF